MLERRSCRRSGGPAIAPIDEQVIKIVAIRAYEVEYATGYGAGEDFEQEYGPEPY